MGRRRYEIEVINNKQLKLINDIFRKYGAPISNRGCQNSVKNIEKNGITFLYVDIAQIEDAFYGRADVIHKGNTAMGTSVNSANNSNYTVITAKSFLNRYGKVDTSSSPSPIVIKKLTQQEELLII